MAENRELNHYQVLGLDYDATPEQIKAAYKRLCQEAAGDALRKPQITRAYSVLSDPKEKKDYDRQINVPFLRLSQPKRRPPAESLGGGTKTEVFVPGSRGQPKGTTETDIIRPGEIGPGEGEASQPGLGDGDKTVIHLKPPPAPAAFLEIRFPDGKTDRRPLKEGETTIGRSKKCDISLPDPQCFVSRDHAVITLRSGRCYVRDDGSCNGTRVGGVDIKGKGEVPLPAGGVIDIEGRKLTLILVSQA
jgi:hypothetical protein